MGINTRALGFATALVAASTFVVCGLFVAVAPGATSSFFSWVFHIDLTGMARPISVASFIGGLVLFSLFLGVCVSAAAWLYNKFTDTPSLNRA